MEKDSISIYSYIGTLFAVIGLLIQILFEKSPYDTFFYILALVFFLVNIGISIKRHYKKSK